MELRLQPIFPLPYAIPDECVVPAVPPKTRVFSDVMPAFGGAQQQQRAYVFGPGEEAAYYRQYQESRFALSPRKGGWDCLRHYEILANGCIPVMPDLETAPPDTMATLPRALVLEARQLLPWQDTDEAKRRYDALVTRLLEHVRAHCTTSALARQFLHRTVPHLAAPKVLLLSHNARCINYSREFLAIALSRHLGPDRFTDAPRLDHLYAGAELRGLYGNGFTYGGRLVPRADAPVPAGMLAERLRRHEWDLVVFGQCGFDERPWHLSRQPFFREVVETYAPHEIVFVFGGDGCQTFDPAADTTFHYTPLLLAAALHGRCAVRELDLRTGRARPSGP